MPNRLLVTGGGLVDPANKIAYPQYSLFFMVHRKVRRLQQFHFFHNQYLSCT